MSALRTPRCLFSALALTARFARAGVCLAGRHEPFGAVARIGMGPGGFALGRCRFGFASIRRFAFGCAGFTCRLALWAAGFACAFAWAFAVGRR